MTSIEPVHGVASMVELASDLERQLGRHILLCPVVSGDQPDLTTPVPKDFGSTNYYGKITTPPDRRRVAFHITVPRAAALLALAFDGELVGTGPHVEYAAPGRPEEDLMSKNVEALRDRRGRVMLVDAAGWESDDAQVANDDTLGPPLLYRLPPQNIGRTAILGIAEVSFADVEGYVRYHPNPRLAYLRSPDDPLA